MSAQYATDTPRTGQLPMPPTWIRLLLGLGLIAAGALVLGDLVLATIISAILIGGAAAAAGLFEIGHALWTRGWGAPAWRVILGILYLGFGFALISQPATGALAITYVLALLFFGSGVLRIYLSLRHWHQASWIMLGSGLFGALAGIAILVGWPTTGLWTLGFLIGLDLLMHGAAWMTYAWLPLIRSV